MNYLEIVSSNSEGKYQQNKISIEIFDYWRGCLKIIKVIFPIKIKGILKEIIKLCKY